MHKLTKLSAISVCLLLSGASPAFASGGGSASSSPACVAQIASVVTSTGYGSFGPLSATLASNIKVKNCTNAPASWTTRLTYVGVSWGNQLLENPPLSTFQEDIPTVAAANSTQGVRGKVQCNLLVGQTYSVRVDVVDATNTVLSSWSGTAATPSTPNPITGS